MNAPVCPVSYSQAKPFPKTIVDLARNIPRATDLQSALAALRALMDLLNKLAHQPPHVNNTVNPRLVNVVMLGEDQVKPLVESPWEESRRVYAQTKVTNPDDTSQFVRVSTITGVGWRNDVTGGNITYVKGL